MLGEVWDGNCHIVAAGILTLDRRREGCSDDTSLRVEGVC